MSENNIVTESMPVTIEKLKCDHPNLVQRLKNAVYELSPSGSVYFPSEPAIVDSNKQTTMIRKPIALETLVFESDKTLSGELNAFLNDLSKLSANPGSTENYLWICDTAISWENRISSMLNISRTVPLSDPPRDLLPVLSAGASFSEAELEKRVDSLAKVVFIYRLKKDHGDDNKSDKKDWHKAEVFLALDILDGAINFARRISSRSYPRFEKVWLAEVRELIAYLDWERDGGKLGDPNTLEHYKKAWKYIKERLFDPSIKANVSEFGEVKKYLEDNYIIQIGSRYELDNNKLNKANDYNIIKIKSNRIGEVIKEWDPDRIWDNDRNWHDAETYVQMYYENIIPAVMGDTESVQKVINAFDYSMKSGTGKTYKGTRRIINAFEIAIAIYFLSIETLEKITIPGDD